VDTGGYTSGGASARAHGLAGRYATALFELAAAETAIDTVENGLAAVRGALAESDDLKTLITSPLVDRNAAAKGIAAVARAMKLDPLTGNFLGVLAKNRRLAALPAIIKAYNGLAAQHRGEIAAEVTAAHELTAKQRDALKAKLKAGFKRDVALDLAVDPAILGGLVVKVGSRMIDSSIRTKLGALRQAMKG
jgi:F-type H+-transporting ATPase subunit delta